MYTDSHTQSVCNYLKSYRVKQKNKFCYLWKSSPAELSTITQETSSVTTITKMLSSEFLRIPYWRSTCYLNTALSSPHSTILNMFSDVNSPSSFTGIIHLVCCASSDWISHKKTVIKEARATPILEYYSHQLPIDSLSSRMSRARKCWTRKRPGNQ